MFNGVVRDFVFQGETAFALMSIGDKYELSVPLRHRFIIIQHVMQPGDQVSLGLNRADAIIIPRTDDR